MNKLLPERPHLGHLKDQARDLVQARRRGDPEAFARIRAQFPQRTPGTALPLHEALWIVAHEYGFPSWAKLKTAVAVDSEAVAAMRKAIDDDDPARVRALLAADPDIVHAYLARAEYYFGNQRPLAYAAQRGRTGIARLLLDAGADLHAEGDLAAARAAMSDANIPLLELFVARGLDVNAVVYDWGPLLTYPAETQAPAMLRWLVARGADPHRRAAGTRCPDDAWTALVGGYDRTPRFHDCVEALLAGGAVADDGPALLLYRGRFAEFADRLRREPALARARYDLSGANLPLQGVTLLHLCADWNFLEAARSLAAHGADLDAPAPVDPDGVGGHTPVFHAVNSFRLWSLPLLEWLLAQGADLAVRATVRWVGKVYRDVTPLGYALRARRNDADAERVAALLRRHGARE